MAIKIGSSQTLWCSVFGIYTEGWQQDAED
jgi:hypothetical protein